MKKAVNLALEDEHIVELMLLSIDGDAPGTLRFLIQHFKGKARDLLEGG